MTVAEVEDLLIGAGKYVAVFTAQWVCLGLMLTSGM
jgi:hypothetical protein